MIAITYRPSKLPYTKKELKEMSLKERSFTGKKIIELGRGFGAIRDEKFVRLSDAQAEIESLEQENKELIKENEKLQLRVNYFERKIRQSND